MRGACVEGDLQDGRREGGQARRDEEVDQEGLRRCGSVVTKKVARRKMRLHWPARARVTDATASGENDAMRGRKEGTRGVVCDEEKQGASKGRGVKGGYQLCEQRRALCVRMQLRAWRRRLGLQSLDGRVGATLRLRQV